MIKMIESKFESKAAKSTTKPCPHAAHLQMGCFHNCKRLRTQEDLFGLQTGNSPGKKCLISFSKEGLATAPKNEVGHRRCPWWGLWLPCLWCPTALQPPRQLLSKTEGQEKPGKLFLQVHSRILMNRKRLWRLRRSPLWPEVHLWKELSEVAFLTVYGL